jgi:uncharacterized DUF497 family protein
MIYEWDKARSRGNLVKQHALTLGLLADQVCVVAHAPRGEDITRIIPMRKANRREQKIYQKRRGEA